MNNAVSLNSALMTSSRIIGPALAGLLVSTVGFGWAFLVDGLSYIAVLAALAMMRTAELRPAPVTPRAKGQVRDGFRYVRSVPDLWVPLVMMAVIGVFAFNFAVVFPLFVTQDLGGSDTAFTILFSIVSVGSLAGALATARRRSIDVHIVAVTALAFGVPMLVLAVVPEPGGGLCGRDVHRVREHRLPHVLDRHRADPGRPHDAGPGARPPGHGVPRLDADRWADPRLDLRGLRRPLGHRRGWRWRASSPGPGAW